MGFGVFHNGGAWWYHFTGMRAIAFLISHVQCHVHVVILYTIESEITHLVSLTHPPSLQMN